MNRSALRGSSAWGRARKFSILRADGWKTRWPGTDWKVCPPPLSADATHDANALASKAPPAPKTSAAATH